MRKIILPVIISASLFGAGTMHAGDEQEKAKEDMPRPILLTKKVPSPQKRPHMPSNQTLMFYYESGSGQCEVQLGADMEWASVTIEQVPVGFYYVGEVTQEAQAFSVEIPAGYYRITCETDGGSTFIGEGDLD